jgi:hypothetical protein
MNYERNEMSEETARQWCSMFKEGQTNVHNEEGSGLVQSVDQKIYEKWCSTISVPSCEFPQISRIVFYI